MRNTPKADSMATMGRVCADTIVEAEGHLLVRDAIEAAMWDKIITAHQTALWVETHWGEQCRQKRCRPFSHYHVQMIADLPGASSDDKYPSSDQRL